MEEEKKEEVVSEKPVDITEGKKDDNALSPVFLIVLVLLLLFVIFLPEVKTVFDKVIGRKAMDASEIADQRPDPSSETGKKEEASKPSTEKKYIIAMAKESDISFTLDELITAVKASSSLGDDLQLTYANNVLTFQAKGQIANFNYANNTFSIEIASDAANKNFYDTSFESLIKALATIHGLMAEDASYTLRDPSFNSYTKDQGFSKITDAGKTTYTAVNNVLLVLLDSSKQIFELSDLGMKESLISSDLNKVKGDLILEVTAKNTLTITIGQKNRIDSLSFDSLDNIISFLYSHEELDRFKDNITELRKDAKKSIYEYEYMPDDVANRFLNYNVVRVTINKKII